MGGLCKRLNNTARLRTDEFLCIRELGALREKTNLTNRAH